MTYLKETPDISFTYVVPIDFYLIRNIIINGTYIIFLIMFINTTNGEILLLNYRNIFKILVVINIFLT